MYVPAHLSPQIGSGRVKRTETTCAYDMLAKDCNLGGPLVAELCVTRFRFCPPVKTDVVTSAQTIGYISGFLPGTNSVG